MFPSEQGPSLCLVSDPGDMHYCQDVNIGAHLGMAINVTAAISGTEYSGELAASNLMVTFAFAAALG